MKKKLLNVLKYVVFLGIGVLLTWWQLGSLNAAQKAEFIDSLRNTRFLVLIPVFLMAVLSHLSRARRWKIMLEPMGYNPSLRNTFYATLIGYFANNFVPRAGEVARCSMMTKYEKIPFSKVLGTVIVERVFDFVCFLVMILITILVQMQTVSHFVSESANKIMKDTGTPLWVKLSGLFAALLILFLLGRWGIKRFANHKLASKFQKIIQELKEGFLSIIHLKKRKEFAFHTIIIWALYLFQIYVGFNAMAETDHLGITAAMSVLVLSTLAMIVAPGGIGAFPVAVQQVLLIYHVENVSFGWLMWGVNTTIIIILGLLSFTLLYFQNKRKNEKNRFPSRENFNATRSSVTGEALET